MYSVTKSVKFDSAHRLFVYDGKCSNIHGHTYIAEVTISRRRLDSQSMVVDFNKISAIFKGWIDDEWDHAIILNELDPLVDALGSHTNRIYTMRGNPTAEGMAEHLYEVLAKKFKDQITSVKIWETPTSFAAYYSERTYV